MTSQGDLSGRPLGEPQRVPAAAHESFPVGLEDLVLLPLVTLAVAVKWTIKGIINLLVRLLDILFPLFMQIMRFPLFTLRILGDGIAALTKVIVSILPVGGTRRAAWRNAISAYWAWLRRKFSYHAFEEWLHHAFEKGMAWVFRRCRTLTPNQALLVIFGAVLWLPISFGAATLMHTLLIAYATSLPAWMQLLHPLATVIAKSKLLVLPVYPAAWPQAKQHPLVQSLFQVWSYLATLYLFRKTAARFRQTDTAAIAGAETLERGAQSAGLTGFNNALFDALNTTATLFAYGVRAVLLWCIAALAAVPVFGNIVRRYEAQYEEVGRHPKPPVSERMNDFYARWSVKFTAKYYEDREREEAAKAT